MVPISGKPEIGGRRPGSGRSSFEGLASLGHLRMTVNIESPSINFSVCFAGHWPRHICSIT